MKLNVNEFKATVSGMIREEVARFRGMVLVTEASGEAFGKWVLRHYGKYLPGTLAPEQVEGWMEDKENAKVLPLTPTQLHAMYRLKGQLQKSFRSPGVNMELDRAFPPAKVPASGETRNRIKGELEYEDMASSLGGSAETARKAVERAVAKVSNFAMKTREGKYTEKDFYIDPEDFGIVVEEAAEKYVKLLKASLEIARGDVESLDGFSVEDFFDGLNEFVLKAASIPLEEITDAERVAVQLLADLVENGQEDEAERLLMKDLLSPNDNVIKTFQNVVARIVFPETRGRPKKQASDSSVAA